MLPHPSGCFFDISIACFCYHYRNSIFLIYSHLLSLDQGCRIGALFPYSICVSIPLHGGNRGPSPSFCYSPFTSLTPFPFPFPAATLTGRLPSNRVGLIPCSVITTFALSRRE